MWGANPAQQAHMLQVMQQQQQAHHQIHQHQIHAMRNHFGLAHVKAGRFTEREARGYAAEILLLQTYADYLTAKEKDYQLSIQLLTDYCLETTSTLKEQLDQKIQMLAGHKKHWWKTTSRRVFWFMIWLIAEMSSKNRPFSNLIDARDQ